MRDKLAEYVHLLFAGTANTDDIQQEILQNSLDKFDDLIGQGKSPEAAYRLVISGIGDISEILEHCAVSETTPVSIVTAEPEEKPKKEKKATSPERKLKKAIGSIISAVGIAVYILLSLATGAWSITWIIFPLIAAIHGLVNAIFDLKEACKHES